jgi:uncharacterized protein (DUF58 family)
LLKYFGTLKFLSRRAKLRRDMRSLKDFFSALVLLGFALVFALMSENAAVRGESINAIVFAALALLIALITALTLVPRLARRVDFSRFHSPFSFSITKQGGGFLLGVFLLSLAAINTGNNLLFLILATLLSTIITSGIIARASLRSLFLSLQVPENVFVGEQVSIKISLTNEKTVFPSFSVSIEDLVASKGSRIAKIFRRIISTRRDPTPDKSSNANSVMRHSAYFPSIRPGETRSELVVQSFPRRGPYFFKGFLISTQFPFGFFRRGERVQANGEVLVYPQIQEIASYYHLLPFMPGKLEGRHMGHGESLYSIREYRDGESARVVDWKATAKTGRLMAREFAREEESRFCLILDSLLPPSPGCDYGEIFEKAVSLAASLAAHFSDEGAQLELITPQEYVPKGIGREHLFRILRSLAVVECRASLPDASTDLRDELSQVADLQTLHEILSSKIFKIIITSKPRGSFSATIWRSSHVVYFDEI